MKKFYALSVVLFFAALSYGQITWIGGGSGNWNTGSNWTGGVVPGSSDSVVFNSSAEVDLNVGSIEIESLTITSNATVKLIGVYGDGTLIIVTNPDYPALRIDAGSRLIDSVYGDPTRYCDFEFAENASAEISGAWVFTGSEDSDGSMLWLAEENPGLVNVNSGGSIVIGENGYSPVTYSGNDIFFVFKNGSLFHFAGGSSQGGTALPDAIFEPASTILVSALQTGIAFSAIDEIGNLAYEFPGQSGTFNLGIPAIVTIKGDLRISNTNNQKLVLLDNPSNSTIAPVIEGDLIIEGNSVVEISEGDPERVISLTVQGDANIGGTAFSLQSLQGINNSSTTTLILQGNLNHTAGTFGASSTVTDESEHLYVVEMNGSAAQTITSHNGSIDNADNQVTLRINNPAGVTLNSPLEVGRLSFNSIGKGHLITTSENVLTINNVSGDDIVVDSPDDDGFVSGPVRRRTITTDTLSIPTGKGSVYRPVSVIPATQDGVTITTYEADYFNTAHASSSQVAHPVLGVSDAEYWELRREGEGAGARVALSLNGPITGAGAEHFIIATRFDGANWVTARAAGDDDGAYLPGDATSGIVSSTVRNSFGYFSFGYVIQSALPTTLAHFNVKKTEAGEAILSWKVTDISTPERFEVTRSSDGINFTTIGTVSGVEHKLDYSFTDRELLTGNNHYRLRMLDKDGSVTYSIVVIVVNGVKGVAMSAPMPSLVSDRTRITVSSAVQGRMQLVITDTYGRVVQQQVAEINKGNQEIWMNAGRLATGIYQVTGYMNGERTSTFRFIKK